MTKTIDLNRKNISEDKIRNMLREKGLGNLLLDDKTLLESRRSFIPDNNKINKDVWLFGYGSLIWNPVIEIEETIIAKVFGYHRHHFGGKIIMIPTQTDSCICNPTTKIAFR